MLCRVVCWRLKTYVFNFLDSFRNKSGKQQPILTSLYTCTGQRPTMFTKFRARSATWGRNGAKKCPRRRFFVTNTRRLFSNFATADFRQIWPRHVNLGWNTDFGQKFMKSFHSGVICPQNPKLEGVKQAPHSEQATGQVVHCREILFTPRCSPRAREFPRSVNCFVWCTVAEQWGVKLAQFSDFGLFSPYKTHKKYLSVTSLQPRGYIAEWFRFFHLIVEGPKGCLPAAEFSCNFW